MSNLHRCPHCGEKAFPHSRWLSMKYEPNTRRRQIDGVYRDLSYKCPACSQRGVFKNHTKSSVKLQVFLGAVGTVVVLVCVLFLQKYFKLLSLLILAADLIAFKLIAYKDRAFVPCDYDQHGNIKYLSFPMNASVTVNNGKYIKPYGVYGLKFKGEAPGTKFKEAFPDGMVPAVFHPTSEGSLTYDVRIIKPEFVPEAVLFPGAKFLVEDYDGIFIAKGTVNKVNLDDTDEE